MKKSKMDKLQRMLASNDLKGAEKLCRNELGRNPQDVNMTALLGAVLLKAGRLQEAEQRLRESIALAPKFAKPYDDLGVLLLRREEFQEAEAIFRQAVTLMPNLGSSWFGLVHALQGQGNLAEAKRIGGMIRESNPDDLTAIRLMAGIAEEEGAVSEALGILRSGVDKQPDSVKTVTDLASFCEKHFQYAKAIEMYRRAVELDPRCPDYHFALGRNLFIVGNSAEALDAYSAGLELDPDSLEGQSGRLYALRAAGRTEEVIAGYRSCIDAGVNIGESWWALSSLRVYTFSDTDLDEMIALRGSDGINDLDAQYLDFALGKAMDDRHRYDEAWQYYSSGNAARRSTVFFDGVQFESKVDAIVTAIDEDIVARGEKVEQQSLTPIFIVGMPRSGSTLIEQILASHNEVEATTELPYLGGLASRWLFSESDDAHAAIAKLSDDELTDLGNQYIKATELNRRQSKRYFIDKMPDNYLYAGLIAAILPNAVIIDARRNPLDACVGNYRQWFASGKEFSYDLEELADYYLQYWRLMQYWDDIMPGRVLRIDYEDVVENTEKQVRRVLEWCGLSWDENCLHFYESDRAVNTASSEQVRQPVYKSAVGFWKNYDVHLSDLKDILESVVD